MHMTYFTYVHMYSQFADTRWILWVKFDHATYMYPCRYPALMYPRVSFRAHIHTHWV